MVAHCSRTALTRSHVNPTHLEIARVKTLARDPALVYFRNPQNTLQARNPGAGDEAAVQGGVRGAGEGQGEDGSVREAGGGAEEGPDRVLRRLLGGEGGCARCGEPSQPTKAPSKILVSFPL